MNEILKEAESLARMGVKELILIAQDTTAYGTDIHSKPALPRLLRKLSRIRSIHWLRLMYTHPAHVTGELVAEFETNPKLCRYIDLPFQHVSDRILGRMGRRHCRRDVELLLTRLKSIPELHIRTTLITGFPGETEAEFEELLDFVRQAELDRLGGYAFSPEPGTRAARLKNQVPPRTRQERLRKLMRVQAAISRRKLRRLLGRIVPVVIDRPGIGRTEWDAPEIDGVVKLSGPSPKPGTFVRVHVLRTGTHDITAERRKPQ
jgi:ribosomal protein S12 methylthiotransferase